MSKYINKEETEKIIKCAYQVHNELGLLINFGDSVEFKMKFVQNLNSISS